MADFNTGKAVKSVDRAVALIETICEDWNKCDTANGSESTIGEAEEPISILMSCASLMNLAASMLEDCTQ